LSRQGRKPNISIVQSEIRRTGTDNMPVNVPTLDTPVAAGPGASVVTGPGLGRMTQNDYVSMAAPAVWRNRTSAAARVDALSSGGMDDFEIPAFLRKQAD